LFLLFFIVLLTVGVISAAAEQTAASTTAITARKAVKGDLAIGLIAIGAGLAIGLAAIATGIAQSRIGAAGLGSIAERPESFGTALIFIAIPETMVILGFVVAIVLMFVL
jgi:V/A-type H+-transporting ATPase subunit K